MNGMMTSNFYDVRIDDFRLWMYTLKGFSIVAFVYT